MEQGDPGGGVGGVHVVLLPVLQHEEERLGETEEEDDVDDRECEHISGDHGEDHGNEWSSQFDCPGKEHEIEPGHGDGEHQQGLLYDAVLSGAGVLPTLLLPSEKTVFFTDIRYKEYKQYDPSPCPEVP